MRFRISGSSMLPSLSDGDYVLVNKWAYLFSAPKIRDVVVVKHNGLFIIKRITKTRNRRYLVQGDGKHSSAAWVERKQIIGKVVLNAFKQQMPFHSMQQNLNSTERLERGVLGIALLLFGYSSSNGFLFIPTLLLGTILLGEAFSGHCVYRRMRKTT